MSGPLALEDAVGVGWRRELAHWIDSGGGHPLVEVMAEHFPTARAVPHAIDRLRGRGTVVVPHSVSLSLAGSQPPDPERLGHLRSVAKRVGAPLVSDHIAFVRSGGMESGHLLPPALTQESLDVTVENVRAAQRALCVPLALENIASLFEWPGAEMTEATFVRELLGRTGAVLLLDVANLYANARNFGWSAEAYLDELPLDRLAYVHVAGGEEVGGFYHDTHAHALPRGPLALLEELRERVPVPAVVLERDDRFPEPRDMERELLSVRASLGRPHAPIAGVGP